MRGVTRDVVKGGAKEVSFVMVFTHDFSYTIITGIQT